MRWIAPLSKGIVRGHGVEDPVEFSVWPGHVPVQRDIDGETYFSHVYAPSLGKILVRGESSEHLSQISSALVWRRFAAFKREEPQAQTIDLVEHSIEGGLIGERAGKPRRAICLLHNL